MIRSSLIYLDCTTGLALLVKDVVRVVHGEGGIAYK